VAEKLEWVVEHWEQIGLVISLIALALTGKWALVRARVAELLVQNGEGEINRAFRKKVGTAAEKEPTIVREVLANIASRTDPDPTKKPESKARRFFKFLGRSAVGVLLRR
jgi:hypothetical protein